MKNANETKTTKTHSKPTNKNQKGLPITLTLIFVALIRQSKLTIQHDFHRIDDVYGTFNFCTNTEIMGILSVWVKEGTTLAYNVNPTPLLKFINHGGFDRYALYDIAPKTNQANCFVTKSVPGAASPNSAERHQFLAILVTTVETSPGNTECRITKVFAPLNTAAGGVDLIPCPNPVGTYKFIEDYFQVEKNGVAQSYTSIPMWSKRKIVDINQIKIATHQPVYIQIGVSGLYSTNLVPADHFDDNFVEMLVLGQANHPWKANRVGIYTDSHFSDMVASQAGVKPAQPMMKPSDLLEKISLKGRSGYHLHPDPSKHFHSYAYTNGFAYHFRQGRFYKAQFYISKPSGISGSRILVIDANNYVRGTNPGFREHKHQIRIHRDVGDPSKLRFSLYETSGVATQKVSFLIDYYSDDRWIHFGMIIGEGLLYYDKDTNEGVFKVFHTLFAMHTDATKTQPVNKKIETASDYFSMPFSLFGATVTHFFETKLSAFADLSMTTPEITDPYETLIFDFDYGTGAVIISPSISKVVQTDPENRCIIPGYAKDKCICFAYLFYFYDSGLAKYDEAHHYTRYGGWLIQRPPQQGQANHDPSRGCDQNCVACFEEGNCLVPKDGFNRKLTTNEVEHLGKKTTLLSGYEGGVGTEGRVRFVSSRGDVFWPKCPPGCNSQISFFVDFFNFIYFCRWHL